MQHNLYNLSTSLQPLGASLILTSSGKFLPFKYRESHSGDLGVKEAMLFSTSSDRLLVQDSINYVYNKAEASWMDKENLYSIMLSDSAIGAEAKSDSVLKHFSDTVYSTNMGLIARAINVLTTDTVLETLEGLAHPVYQGEFEAANYISYVSPTNTIEQNYQTVYNLYLNYILFGSKLDSSQLADLQAVANECPRTGGAAVYTARGILGGIYSTPFDTSYSFYYNDDSLCIMDTTEVFRMKIKPQPVVPTASFVNVYPNPAKDEITFTYQYSGTANATLDIYDVLGTKMGEYVLSASQEQYVLGLTNLSNGVYYYRLTTPCCEIGTGKFVVVK